MGAYEYSALDPRGRRQRGVLQGDTSRQVRQLLRERGLSPLAVEPVAEGRSARGFGFKRALSANELALVLRQLASLSGAGIALEEALATVAEQAERRPAKRVLVALRARVMEGHSLSAAMGDFPRAFPDLVRATIAAGETSGHLDRVLERLADYAESKEQLGRKVLLAALYPAIVAAVAVATVIGLLAYVVPQVVSMFESFDQTLPPLTRALISVSDFTQRWGRILGLGTIAAVALAVLLLRRASVRQRWHRALLATPVAGRLIRAVNTARFTRTLSILTASAVPLLDALKISGQVMANLPMRAAVERARARVREGTSLNQALKATGLFPPMVTRLIASGEQSGELEDMLARASDHQDREVENTVAVLMGVLEPALILAVGAVVLTMVLAILLPIFQMNKLIQ